MIFAKYIYVKKYKKIRQCSSAVYVSVDG